MAHPIKPYDIHEFEIDKEEPIWSDMGPLLVIQVKDSGGVSGTLYGKQDCPTFVGKAHRDPINKYTMITIEIPPNEGD